MPKRVDSKLICPCGSCLYGKSGGAKNAIEYAQIKSVMLLCMRICNTVLGYLKSDYKHLFVRLRIICLLLLACMLQLTLQLFTKWRTSHGY